MSLERSSASITPLSIFLGADIVVQSVITILLFASVFSWGVMLSRTIAIAVERRKVKAVSEILSSVEKLDELRELANNGNGKVHSILRSLAGEWKWSNDYASRNYEEIRQRIIAISEISVDRQYVRLARNSAWLATISYTAPFIGLFGTVWGIMNSFVAMGQAQDTSLATVAPGMAEALFATAVGLFCAIPASLGYNRIVQALLATDQEWRAIIGRVEVAISRHYGVVRRPL